MKTKYVTIIVLLISTYILIVIQIKSGMEYSEWINSAASIGATFAAIITAVIALSVADKPQKRVKFDVVIDKEKTSRTKNSECPPLKLKEGVQIDNPLETMKVHFRIKNTSGFTLNKPVLTFILPSELQHPRRENGNYVTDRDGRIIMTFHSNLFNVQKELRLYNYDDIVVLSNNVLPYLNDGQKHPVWIRMCRLKKKSGDPWIVLVELNCDNAEGVTKRLKLEFD